MFENIQFKTLEETAKDLRVSNMTDEELYRITCIKLYYNHIFELMVQKMKSKLQINDDVLKNELEKRGYEDHFEATKFFIDNEIEPFVIRFDDNTETEEEANLKSLTIEQFKAKLSDSGMYNLDIDRGLDGFSTMKKIVTPTTLFFTIEGNSMIDANIDDGDMAVVETADTNYQNKICAVSVSDRLFIKKVKSENGVLRLISANPNYEDYVVPLLEEVRLIGVVKYLLKKVG